MRFEAVGRSLERFLWCCQQMKLRSQVVSLGAGSDSRYFLLQVYLYGAARARDQRLSNLLYYLQESFPTMCQTMTYFELDFPEITRQKRQNILKHARLRAMLGTIAQGIRITDNVCTPLIHVVRACKHR